MSALSPAGCGNLGTQCDFAMPWFSSSVLLGSEMTRVDTWNSAEHRLDAQEADANVISESRVHF